MLLLAQRTSPSALGFFFCSLAAPAKRRKQKGEGTALPFVCRPHPHSQRVYQPTGPGCKLMLTCFTC